MSLYRRHRGTARYTYGHALSGLSTALLHTGFHAQTIEQPMAPRRALRGREWRCPAPCARIHKGGVRACPVCGEGRAS